MALELFRPFVISKLIEREYVYNVRSANRFIESDRPEVWDILEEITLKAFVLLNRAPTLHRLGIQAFRPILIEGKAIQIHPLVCTAFNADFDGDQMAVHVPLTEGAVDEAENIMLSAKNLLKPATGEPVVTPSQDIVLGAYFMTAYINEEKKENLFHFYDFNEVKMALSTGRIEIGTKVKVRLRGKLVETSAGRIMFNEVLPEDQQFCNKLIDKKELKDIIAECFARQGLARTAQLLDDVKDLAIEMITVSGMSWGMGDTPVPPEKEKVMNDSEKKVAEIQGQYDMGLLTDEERRQKVIEIWTNTKNDITDTKLLVFRLL